MLILVVVVWMLLFVCLGLNCSVVCCVGFGFALLGCVFVVLLLLLGCVSWCLWFDGYGGLVVFVVVLFDLMLVICGC